LVVHVSGAVEQEALFEYISENEERKVSSVSGVTELGVDGPVKDDVTYIPLDRIGTLKGGVYTPSVEKAADTTSGSSRGSAPFKKLRRGLTHVQSRSNI
jgi:hypothetical protein